MWKTELCKNFKINLPCRSYPWLPSSRSASRICSRPCCDARCLRATPCRWRDTWSLPDVFRLPAEERSCGRPSAWPWSGKASGRRPERSEGWAERSSASASSGHARWSGKTTFSDFFMERQNVFLTIILHFQSANLKLFTFKNMFFPLCDLNCSSFVFFVKNKLSLRCQLWSTKTKNNNINI